MQLALPRLGVVENIVEATYVFDAFLAIVPRESVQVA